MNITSLDGSIYLLELSEPFERLEFQFMPPNFVWDRKGDWANFPIVGRNNSKKQLTGGEDVLQLTLDFNSLYEDNKQLCMEKMGWLQSLTANDGFAGKSRRVKLAWGSVDIFRHKIWVVRNVRATAGDFNSNFGYAPTQIALDVTLELDPDFQTSLDDIRVISSFPGGKDTSAAPNVLRANSNGNPNFGVANG